MDFDKRACKVPGSNEPFPVLEKAWDVIESRKKAKKSDELIFPYNRPSVTLRFISMKKKLRESMPSLKDLRFHDLRYEAVNRLLEKGHPPHTVAHASGMHISKVIEIHRGLEKGLR